MKKWVKGMICISIFVFSLNSAEICGSGCSILVPCATGGYVYCEVRKVNSAVCEGITCSGGRQGCKAYGYCFLIPKSVIACCPPDGPKRNCFENFNGFLFGEEVKFEKVFKIEKKEVKITIEKDNLLQDPHYNFFYGFKDFKENLFVGVIPAQHKIFINLNSKEILKENASFWIKYMPDKKYLFYLTKKNDTISEIHKLDLNSLKDDFLTSFCEDQFLLSSPFFINDNKIILKNKNTIEIFDISGKKLKEFLFKVPSNIVKKYDWQNEGWFLGHTKNYIYVFFNSLPYVIILDTSFNLLRAYDFYENKEIEEILLEIEKEYNEVKEKGECRSYTISECFSISPDKIIWIFGNSCFIFENDKFSKKITFNTFLGLEKIDIVPFSIFEISDGFILLNFSNLGWSVIEKEKL